MMQLAILLVLGSTLVHAGWNLLAHRHRAAPYVFLHMAIWSVGLGLGPAMLGAAMGELLPAAVWGWAVASGLCLTIYMLGLTQGYRSGEFTVVYPLARALPIAMLVLFDLARGRAIEPAGYVGLALVAGGCLLLAGNGGAGGAGRASVRTLAWVMVIAMGTVGYTAVDKVAMEHVAEGHWILAVQYGTAQFLFALPGLWVVLRWMHGGSVMAAPWWVALLVGAGNLLAYVLVLVAYQLVDQASYVLALRQFSIVIGAGLGVWLLREPSPGSRLVAAAVITVGVSALVVTMAR